MVLILARIELGSCRKAKLLRLLILLLYLDFDATKKIENCTPQCRSTRRKLSIRPLKQELMWVFLGKWSSGIWAELFLIALLCIIVLSCSDASSKTCGFVTDFFPEKELGLLRCSWRKSRPKFH